MKKSLLKIFFEIYKHRRIPRIFLFPEFHDPREIEATRTAIRIIRVSDSVCESNSRPRLPDNLINNPSPSVVVARTNFGDRVE